MQLQKQNEQPFARACGGVSQFLMPQFIVVVQNGNCNGNDQRLQHHQLQLPATVVLAGCVQHVARRMQCMRNESNFIYLCKRKTQ